QPTTAAGLAWAFFVGCWLRLVGFRFSVWRAADGSPRVRVLVRVFVLICGELSASMAATRVV
ncbi:MAG: hypothetical protein ACK6EB_16680, partial [Planctomyces sp.]